MAVTTAAVLLAQPMLGHLQFLRSVASPIVDAAAAASSASTPAKPRTPPPLPVGELSAKRTRTSTTQYNANHTFTTTVYDSSVNYLDRQGRWQRIDSTLGSTSARGYAYQNRANNFQTQFKQTLGDDAFRLVTDGQPVSFSLAGASQANAIVKGTSVEYANALSHVTAHYDVGAQAVEETLVLQDRSAASTFRFLMKAPAGTTTRQQPDGSWAFRIPGHGQTSFALTPPIAYDSSHSLDPGNGHAQMTVQPVTGGFQVDLALDRAWLDDPARRFPVFLDPTVSIQPDSNDATFQADCSRCQPFIDTTTGRIYIGTDGSHPWREAIQFDLSAIPAGVSVTGASLGIYYDSFWMNLSGTSGPSISHQVDAHVMTAPWSASTTTGNVKFSSTVLSSFTLPAGPSEQWMTWNVASAVSGWVSGTQANNGLYLMRSTEPKSAGGPAPPGMRFTGEPSLRPQLTVTFSGDAVELSQPTVLHSNGPDLSWSQYTGPSGAPFQKYDVHRSTTPNFTPSTATLLTSINDYTVTNYRDTSAAPNKTFYYAVVANTSKSNEIKVTLPADGQATMFLQPGPSDGGKDTGIYFFTGTTNCANYGAAGETYIGSASDAVYRDLFQFDLHQVPTNASIVSAQLNLYHWNRAYSSGTSASMSLHAYPVTGSWNEGTGTDSPPTCTEDGATWYETTGGANWAAQGGDYDASTSSSQVTMTANESAQWSIFDISTIVGRWVSGQKPNLGLLVRSDDESLVDNQWIAFDSSDFTGTAGLRPKLQVTYNDGSHAVAPTVAVSAPASGATVAGSAVSLTASAADDRSVTEVQFFVDGGLVGTATASPWKATWNSSAVANGSHTLTAVATDDAGNVTPSGAMPSVPITVNNAPPPTTSITSPANNASGLTGTVTVTSSDGASSGLSVSKVELYVDGALYATTAASPYSFSWNTLDPALPSYDGSAHSLITKVYDSSGLVTTSSPASVTTGNTVGTKYVAGFGSSAVPQAVSFDPNVGSQLTYPVNVTVTNNSGQNWSSATTSLHYNWYSPRPGDPVIDSGSVAALGLNAGANTQVQVAVTPPTVPDGVNAEQFTLRMEVVDTSGSSPVAFAAMGNPPLDNPVIVNKVLSTKLGLEHFYQYTSMPVGAGMTSMVNVANGDSLLNMTPLSEPGRGVSTFVDLTYNSLEEHSESPAGNDWSLSVSSLTRFGRPLDIHPNNADTIAGRSNKFIEFVDGTGTLQHFDGVTGSDGVTFWKEPPGVHLYLRSVTTDTTNPKFWAITRPDRSTFYFNSAGYPTFVTDKNGNTLSFTLTAVQPGDDPGGPKFHITKVTDASGQGSNPAPNRSFNITYFTKATAKKPQIRGKVASITDHLGHELDFSYYDDGNLLSLTEQGGTNADGSPLASRSWIFTYTTSSGSGPAIPDSTQRVNPDPKTPNESTRIFSTRDPLGHETQFIYDGPGSSQDRWKVASIQDRAGNATTFSYDDVNLLTTVAAPTPSGQTARTTKYAYDVTGRPTQITNPLGQATSLQWSADNAVARLTEPNTNFQQFAYNDNGELTDQFDQLGDHTVLAYQNVAADANDVSAHWNLSGGANGTGRTIPHISQLATKQDPKEVAGSTQNKWSFSYDGNGNLTQVTEPLFPNNPAVDTYNADGTLASSKDFNGNLTTYASYDASGLPTRVVDATDNPSAPTHPTQLGYDPGGRLLFVQDPNHASFTGGLPAQYQTQFFYDSFNRLGRQSTPKSTSLNLTDLVWADTAYDANNNVVRQVAPHFGAQDTGAGDTTTATYDAMDHQTQVTGPDTSADPAGERTGYQYDVAGRMIQVTLPLGVQNGTPSNTHTINNTYDAVDRVTVQTENHDTGSGILLLNTLSCYDSVSNLVSVTAPKAGLSSVTCPATTQTPFTTVYAYDADHRVTSVNDPLNHQTQLGYDANGNRTQVTDANGNTTTSTYDALNRVIQVCQPFLGTVPQVCHPGTSHPAVTTMQYDAKGNLTRQISPRGYDASSDKSTFTNYVTAYHYDALNRLIRSDLPVDGTFTTQYFAHNVYDFNGNLVSSSLPVTTSDPTQVAATSKTQLSYLDPGWIATSQDPGGPRVHFDYTAKGEQSLRTPETTSGSLDLTKQIQWTYFADGQTRSRVDQQGQPITYTYDAENHLVSSHDASGLTTPSQTFVDTQNAYDDLGRLTRTDLKKQTDANWTFSTFAYDANANIADQVQNGQESSPGGALVKAGRSLHNDYDGANWISTQFDYGSGTPSSPSPDAQRTLNTFTPNGLEASREIDKANGSGGWTPKQTTAWDYFANGKLNHLTTKNGSGATLEAHTVGYLDTNGIYVDGNRTQDSLSLQPGSGMSSPCFPTTCNASYTYDPRDRLVSQNDGHGSTTAYTLDPSGNILGEAINGATTKTYSYLGAQLQQVTAGGQTSKYWYDDLGRLHCVTTSAGSASDCGSGPTGTANLLADYEYDYLDRLSTYQAYSGGSRTDNAQYAYDALNRVASESELHPGFNGTPRTTQFSYLGLGAQLTEEQRSNTTGTLGVKDYTYDAFGHRLSMTSTPFSGGTAQPASTFTYGYDVHGSVSQLVDANGNTQASYGYKAYGQTDTSLTQGDTDPLNPLNPFRFSAKRADTGSGTLDMGARRFGPDTSRFLTPDLFYGALSNLSLSVDPITQNRYGLAGGNPISFKEWDGHVALADGGGGAATTPAPNLGPGDKCGGCEDMPARDAVVVAGTVNDVQGQTTPLQIAQNAKAGANWQAQVRQSLQQQYDPNKYDIVENRGIVNQNGDVVKINGRYVRPDYQVIDKASGRIAAIYEAKTGSVTYLSGPGQKVLLRYQQYASQVGYKAPPVKGMYKVRDPSREAVEDRPAGALDYLGGAVAVIGAIDLGLQLYEQEQQRQRYQQQLDWLKQNDPDYYNRLQQADYDQYCQQAGSNCA
jgi:RHS repeat-associated protein